MFYEGFEDEQPLEKKKILNKIRKNKKKKSVNEFFDLSFGQSRFDNQLKILNKSIKDLKEHYENISSLRDIKDSLAV